MTKYGEKLVGIDPEQLRRQLRTENDTKAAKQLTVVLLYNAGFSPYQIKELLGFPVQTGYNWLNIVAERDYAALGNAPQSGRPPRLSAKQFDELTATHVASPTEAGYTDPAWSPDLPRNHIRETYTSSIHAHTYTVILKKAGLSAPTARPVHYKADPAEQRCWRAEFKKVAGTEG